MDDNLNLDDLESQLAELSAERTPSSKLSEPEVQQILDSLDDLNKEASGLRADTRRPEISAPQMGADGSPDFSSDMRSEQTSTVSTLAHDSKVACAATSTARKRLSRRDPLCYGRPGYFDEKARTCRRCSSMGDCRSTVEVTRRERAAKKACELHEVRPDRIATTDASLGMSVSQTNGASTDNTRAACPILHAMRDAFAVSHARSRGRYQRHDREYQRHRRANPRPEDLLEAEYLRRLRALRRALQHKWPDKRLEQLRGREAEIALFWKARQLALLKYGSRVSDAKVAEEFRSLPAAPSSFTRHQTRSLRKLVEKLERPGGVWKFRTDA